MRAGAVCGRPSHHLWSVVWQSFTLHSSDTIAFSPAQCQQELLPQGLPMTGRCFCGHTHGEWTCWKWSAAHLQRLLLVCVEAPLVQHHDLKVGLQARIHKACDAASKPAAVNSHRHGHAWRLHLAATAETAACCIISCNVMLKHDGVRQNASEGNIAMRLQRSAGYFRGLVRCTVMSFASVSQEITYSTQAKGIKLQHKLQPSTHL